MSAAGTPTRTWGPFTGRHLTVMIVSLMIGLVMVPSTVWAVDTFSNVAIEDPVSGAKASVDSRNNLAVAGTVHALAASPTTPFAFSEDVNGAGKTRVLGPTASVINLTALSVSLKHGQPSTGDFDLYVGSQPFAETTCDNTVSFTLYHIPAVQVSPVFVQNFPTPLVVAHPAAGTKTCLYGYEVDDSLATWTVNGSGFLGK